MAYYWTAVICILDKVFLASGCDDVLNKCYQGQYGYDNTTYLPIDLHFSVLEGKDPNEIDRFCSNYPQLKTCFYGNLLVCNEDDPIWMQLEGTDWMNVSLCSPDGKKHLEDYQKCVQDGGTFSCQKKSMGLTSEITNKQCSKYSEYKACVKKAVVSNCSSDLDNWLDSYFDLSYISQICNTQCQRSPDCIETNPQLLKKKTECFDVYQNNLLGGGILGLLGVDACRITREYAACELAEDAKYCGMPSTIVERQKIHIAYMDQLILINCRLDDVEFDWPHIKSGTTVDGEPCVRVRTTTKATDPKVDGEPYVPVTTTTKTTDTTDDGEPLDPVPTTTKTTDTTDDGEPLVPIPTTTKTTDTTDDGEPLDPVPTTTKTTDTTDDGEPLDPVPTTTKATDTTDDGEPLVPIPTTTKTTDMKIALGVVASVLLLVALPLAIILIKRRWQLQGTEKSCDVYGMQQYNIAGSPPTSQVNSDSDIVENNFYSELDEVTMI